MSLRAYLVEFRLQLPLDRFGLFGARELLFVLGRRRAEEKCLHWSGAQSTPVLLLHALAPDSRLRGGFEFDAFTIVLIVVRIA